MSQNNFWKYQFEMYGIKKNWTKKEINSLSDLIPNRFSDTYPQNIQVVKSYYFVIFIFKKWKILLKCTQTTNVFLFFFLFPMYWNSPNFQNNDQVEWIMSSEILKVNHLMWVWYLHFINICLTAVTSWTKYQCSQSSKQIPFPYYNLYFLDLTFLLRNQHSHSTYLLPLYYVGKIWHI